MSPSQDPPSRPSGREARAALEAVLDDQARRAELRDRPPPRPPDRRGLKTGILLVLLALTVWVLVAPPAFLMPQPLPEPEPAEVEAGLRMEVWVAAMSLLRHRETHGSYPETLDEAWERPGGEEALVYERLGGDRFRLTGRRDTLEIVYDSTQPIEVLRAPLQERARVGS